jgi:hypothetical protein
MPVANRHFHNVDHFSFGPSYYVPKLQGLAAWHDNHNYLVDFGTPVPADTDGVANDLAVGTTTTSFTDVAGIVGGVLDARWGRTLTLVGSGAGTNAVTLNGYDYLNQPIQKVTAVNGTTPVAISVAFKRLTSIVIASGGSITVDIGFGALFGLPYKTLRVLEELVDGALGTAGTLTAPVLTDPATNATGDPRGLYTPNVTPDGTKLIQGRFVLDGYINSSGNGGLHGIRHYGG